MAIDGRIRGHRRNGERFEGGEWKRGPGSHASTKPLHIAGSGRRLARSSRMGCAGPSTSGPVAHAGVSVAYLFLRANIGFPMPPFRPHRGERIMHLGHDICYSFSPNELLLNSREAVSYQEGSPTTRARKFLRDVYRLVPLNGCDAENVGIS